MNGPLVLINANAGGGRGTKLARQIGSQLAAHGARLVVTDSANAAVQALAQLPRGQRVVVAGGDGSVQALLPHLLEGEHELGLVPIGGGNDLARALGLLGRTLDATLDHALKAPASPIDLGALHLQGQSEPRLFASSLAAGFDAAIAARARLGPPWLGGLPRYLWATLGELITLRTMTMTVDADDQRVHDGIGLFTSCLNTPTYGSGMPATPKALLDDGRLDVLMAGRFGRLGALAMLPRLLTGTHVNHPRVQVLTAQQLRVCASEPIALAADGEPLTEVREFSVTVLPGTLRVVRAGGRVS